MAFLRVAARVVAAMTAALAGPLVPVAATAATGPGPVTVELGSLDPALPGPADTLTLTGRLANTSAGRIDGARMDVRVGGGGVVAGSATPVAGLGPKAGESFRLTVPVAALKLGGPGTYRLTVELTGGGRVLGATDTVLPWAPAQQAQQAQQAQPSRQPQQPQPAPRKVSVIWPLTDTPHMEAVALVGGDAAQPVFRDDALAAELASGGRLSALVAAASGLPVTWTADPALLDEARAMAGGYRVANTPDTANPQDSRPGTGGHAAASWLAALRTAAHGGQVLQLPYGDPDLTALARQGADSGFLGTVLGEAAKLGAAATTGALGSPGSSNAAPRQDAPVAWPWQGAADASFTAAARRLGYGMMPAGDPAIGAVLARPMADGSDVLAARQQILADLLADAPAGSGPLVVVPPRQMSAQAAQALGSALRAALAAGRIQGAPAAPGGSSASGDPAGGPGASGIAVLRGIQPRLDTLSEVLSDPARTTAAVHRAILRALSTGWRADPAGEPAYARGVAAYVDASIASVRLLPKSGTVTMPGTSASVPVTIANGLQQPLAGLELRVTSGAPGRVTVDTPRSAVTAPAAANRTQQVRISAHHEGPVRLTAQLYTTADGRPWGAPVSFQVDVTSLPQGTVTVVAGAVLLILLAALVKVRLARRRAGA